MANTDFGMKQLTRTVDGDHSSGDDGNQMEAPRPLEHLKHLASILDTSAPKRMDDVTLLNEIGRYERLCDMDIFVYSDFIDAAGELLELLRDEAVNRFRRIVMGDACAS